MFPRSKSPSSGEDDEIEVEHDDVSDIEDETPIIERDVVVCRKIAVCPLLCTC